MSERAAPTIIFLHVGKTAGATLRQALRRQFRRPEIFELRAPNVEPGRLRRDGAVAYFSSLPEAARARPRLIMGHMTFGLHEHVPRPSTYVTMVRDPIALVSSQFRHVWRHPGHFLHGDVHRFPTLRTYVEGGLSLETDNSQTRAFAGDTTTPFGGCTPAMLDQAKRNLESWFAVVGVTERFDESMVLLQRAFGWKLRYVPTNVAPDRDRVTIGDEDLQVVRERNRFDVELYTWAVGRFDRAVTEADGFDTDLDALRARNHRFARWDRIAGKPRRALQRLSAE